MRNTGEIAGAHSTAEVDFSCRTCRHRTTLSLAVEAVVYNHFDFLAHLLGEEWLTRRAERQAESNLVFARSLARCPRCKTRSSSAAHARLILNVTVIGLIVGLIGAIPGLMAAVYLGQSALGGMLLRIAAVGLVAGVVTYRRRITDVDRWTTFADLE